MSEEAAVKVLTNLHTDRSTNLFDDDDSSSELSIIDGEEIMDEGEESAGGDRANESPSASEFGDGSGEDMDVDSQETEEEDIRRLTRSSSDDAKAVDSGSDRDVEDAIERSEKVSKNSFTYSKPSQPTKSSKRSIEYFDPELYGLRRSVCF
jgi:hypothetical protein